MRKYLVNYRVDISETSTIPYLEYTAIYEVESMMTQEDVEAPTLMCKGCVYNGKFECIQADGLVLNMSNGFTICLDMEIDEFKKLIKGNLWQRIWQKLLSRNYEDRGLQKSRTNSFYHQQT